ncbi:hypothetical protein L0F63_005080 [Massospora cicadina]|nr:hypothetical protein L0F63_005080 [Massospora cicadina]
MKSISPKKRICTGIDRNFNTAGNALACVETSSSDILPRVEDQIPDPLSFKPYNRSIFSRLKRAFDYEDEAIPNLSYGYGESQIIQLGILDGMTPEEHQITSVDDVCLFGSVYLVIVAYSHYTLSSKVVLYDVITRLATALPVSEPGYITHVSVACLSDTSTGSLSDTFTETHTARLLMAFGVAKPKISGHLVTVTKDAGKGQLRANRATSFDYPLSDTLKLSCLKSWVVKASESVVIGFGTVGGSFQLLTYPVAEINDTVPPILDKAFSLPFSAFGSADPFKPITWLDLKMLETGSLMLLVGRGSLLYESTLHPSPPAFSVVSIHQDFSQASLIYCQEKFGDVPGAFIGASLTKVASELHLAFAVWQCSKAPAVQTHHLVMEGAAQKFHHWHEDSFTLTPDNLPLDFHSAHLSFRLATVCGEMDGSLPYHRGWSGPELNDAAISFTGAEFFLEKCWDAATLERVAASAPLVLPNLPFFKNFLVADASQELVIPPASGHTDEFLSLIRANLARPEFEDVALGYCLAFISEESAKEFAKKYLTLETYALVLGYKHIDSGCVGLGVRRILSSNLKPHFPQELLDLVLRSNNPVLAAQLWVYLNLHRQPPEVTDPKELVRGLFSLGVAEAHAYLKSYHEGVVSRQVAYWEFYKLGLAEDNLTFTNYLLSHPLSLEEEDHLLSFLSRDDLPPSILANGLGLFVNYRYQLLRLSEALGFFFSHEFKFQRVCSPEKYAEISKLVTCASERLEASRGCVSNNAAIKQVNCIGGGCIQSNPPALPNLPLSSLLTREGLTSESICACIEQSAAHAHETPLTTKVPDVSGNLPRQEEPPQELVRSPLLPPNQGSPINLKGKGDPITCQHDASGFIEEVDAEGLATRLLLVTSRRLLSHLINIPPSTQTPSLKRVAFDDLPAHLAHSLAKKRKSLPSQSTRGPHDASADVGQTSQYWPPLGERFPEAGEDLQERYPNFMAPESSSTTPSNFRPSRRRTLNPL